MRDAANRESERKVDDVGCFVLGWRSLGLRGGIGRHNRLKICRSQSLPVRVRPQVPSFVIGRLEDL